MEFANGKDDDAASALRAHLLSNDSSDALAPPSQAAIYHAEQYNATNYGGGKLSDKNRKSSDALGGFASQSASDCMTIYTADGSVDSKGRPSIRAETGGWKTCPFILGNECCERLAFYGINANLVNYLTRVLLQGNAAAAKNVAIWSGTGYVAPLFGAFVADAYLGRYRTIATFSAVYLIGLILLTISSSVTSLKPPPCLEEVYRCQKASPGQLGFFYLSLYLIAVGMGGIKSCVSSFGADQFDDADRSERKKKTHFFNWFYLSINIGSLIATTILVYIQDNVNWGLGYGIPAVFMAVAIFTFLLGTPIYRYQKPEGSPFSRIAQVFIAAASKKSIKLPTNERDLYGYDDEETLILGTRIIQHTQQFKFLDKAAILMPEDELIGLVPSPWRLCPVSQVEEVKTILRMFPIWITSIFFSTVYAQMSSLFVEQGSRMDNRLGENFRVPPASLSTVEILTVVFCIPIYDRILVKLVRKFTGHQQGFSQLRRMGIGMCISIFAMLVASAVEVRRLQIAQLYGLINDPVTPVPTSILWQVPQYFLIGLAETFTYIGQLEFFYQESPDTMRSLGTAMAVTTFGLGYYLNSFLLAIVTGFTSSNNSPGWISDNLNLGHLDYYFNLLALLSCVNLIFYIWVACSFKYRETKVVLVSAGSRK